MVNISIILREKRKNQEGAPCHMPPPCHTSSTLSCSPPCRFERSEKSPSCGRERIKGRPLTSFGETEKGVRVTFLPCPAEQYRGMPHLNRTASHPCHPEACKRRGTPRFARGDKKERLGVTKKRGSG